jgi:hypothetical protein
MDNNNQMTIEAPEWLDATLRDHDGEPEELQSDASFVVDRLAIPLGFV